MWDDDRDRDMPVLLRPGLEAITLAYARSYPMCKNVSRAVRQGGLKGKQTLLQPHQSLPHLLLLFTAYATHPLIIPN